MRVSPRTLLLILMVGFLISLPVMSLEIRVSVNYDTNDPNPNDLSSWLFNEFYRVDEVFSNSDMDVTVEWTFVPRDFSVLGHYSDADGLMSASELSGWRDPIYHANIVVDRGIPNSGARNSSPPRRELLWGALRVGVNYITIAHELGHVFGATHAGRWCSNFDPTNGYTCTIMVGNGAFPGPPEGGVTPLPRFSVPSDFQDSFGQTVTNSDVVIGGIEYVDDLLDCSGLLISGRFCAIVTESDGTPLLSSLFEGMERGGKFAYAQAPKDPQVFLKILNACQSFGGIWIFVSDLTNETYITSIRDMLTGDSWSVSLDGAKDGPVEDYDALRCP